MNWSDRQICHGILWKKATAAVNIEMGVFQGEGMEGTRKHKIDHLQYRLIFRQKWVIFLFFS